jgi:hypothetical protein
VLQIALVVTSPHRVRCDNADVEALQPIDMAGAFTLHVSQLCMHQGRVPYCHVYNAQDMRYACC